MNKFFFVLRKLLFKNGVAPAISKSSIIAALFIALASLTVLAQVPAYVFSGHVYQGNPPDVSRPVGGVTVELYGDRDEWPESGPRTLLATATTNKAGGFRLYWELRGVEYPYYHIIEIDPAGVVSTGAHADRPGYVKNFNVVSYLDTPPGDYVGISFWDSHPEVLLREGWCCWKGEIFPSFESGCLKQGGKFFFTEEEARNYCQPVRPREEFPLEEAISGELVGPLKEVGIYTGEQLMAEVTSQAALESLTEKTGLASEDLMFAALKVELITLEGVGPREASLLKAVGAKSVAALAQIEEPEVAILQIELANLAEQAGWEAPSEAAIQQWIGQAKSVEHRYFAGLTSRDIFTGAKLPARPIIPERVVLPPSEDELALLKRPRKFASVDEDANVITMKNTNVFTIFETIGDKEIVREYLDIDGHTIPLNLAEVEAVEALNNRPPWEGLVDRPLLRERKELVLCATKPVITAVNQPKIFLFQGGKGIVDILGYNFGIPNQTIVDVGIFTSYGQTVHIFHNVPVKPYWKAPHGVRIDLASIKAKLPYGPVIIKLARPDGCVSNEAQTEIVPSKCWQSPMIKRINQHKIYLHVGGKGIVDILGVNFGMPNQEKVNVKLTQGGKVVHTFYNVLVKPYAKEPHGVRVDLATVSNVGSGWFQFIIQRSDKCSSNPGQVFVIPKTHEPYILGKVSGLKAYAGEKKVFRFGGSTCAGETCQPKTTILFPAYNWMDATVVDVPFFLAPKSAMANELRINLVGSELPEDGWWQKVVGWTGKAVGTGIGCWAGGLSGCKTGYEMANKAVGLLPEPAKGYSLGAHGNIFRKQEPYHNPFHANEQMNFLPFDTTGTHADLHVMYHVLDVPAPMIKEVRVTLKKVRLLSDPDPYGVLDEDCDMYVWARAFDHAVGQLFPAKKRFPATGEHELDEWETYTINSIIYHKTYSTPTPVPMIYLEVGVWDGDPDDDDALGLLTRAFLPHEFLPEQATYYTLKATPYIFGKDGSCEFEFEIFVRK